jgi:ubiquinone biosynthesis protein
MAPINYHRGTFRPAVCRERTSPWKIARFISEAQLRWFLSDSKAPVGKWIKEGLTSLGPAFIKLGQFLSTRPDILGDEAVAELSKLQDNIVPVGFDEIQFVIENSLGRPWQDVFSHIDPISMASASIGQVHRATLKDGTDVVVKIQKPCVAKQIKDDIDTLNVMNRFFAMTGNPRSMEINNILKQYERFLSAELDYRIELGHMVKFYEMLQGLPVRVPHVYSQYSDKNMLVMEYVGSTKITDTTILQSKGFDTARIAESLVQVFLYQIVYLGYVHCDPHPGNIGVADDGETIVMYDFGNVIELSRDFRKYIYALVFSIFQRDVDEFVHILVTLKVVRVQDDLERLELKEFFRVFFSYLENQDFNSLRESILQQQKQGGMDVKLHVDPDFLALFRVFSLLDGTCIVLDPKFNYIECLRPYVQDIMQDTSFLTSRAVKDFEKLRAYPGIVKNTDDNMLRLHKRVSNMNTTIQRFQIMYIFMLCANSHDAPTILGLTGMMFLVWKWWDAKVTQ